MKNEDSENSSSTNNYQKHWDTAYSQTPNEKLGWYEDDHSPTFQLLDETTITSHSNILIAGAGSTTLVDALLAKGFSQLIATDISEVSLQKLEDRVGIGKIEIIVDDLSHPNKLSQIASVDIWVDRAVLHFLTESTDQTTYFDLLKSKLKKGGYALFAEFGLGGATKCCGLPIQQYENDQFQSQLGNEFELVSSFNHTYHNPNGDSRKYIYSLFKRI